MKKYLLNESDIHKGNLILVNQNFKLSFTFNNFSLVSFNHKFEDILIDKEANKYLQFILSEIHADNKIVPVSGFRSLEEQRKIFNDSLKENGRAFTYKYVAIPNASEHQTGLAIDLGLNKEKIDFIRPSFPYDGICNEFRKNSIKYGFIERYKKEKEKITGISAEEWHFRFVGYPHSEIIELKGFCLEEYIDFLKKNNIKYKNYEICYIPFDNKTIELELNDFDQVSGNNVDGFIITKIINVAK